MSSNRIDALLRQLPELQTVSRRVGRADALKAALADALPAGLAASATVTVSDAGEVVLYADNGAVAAKLRQLAPRILNSLRQRGNEVTAVRVQVQVTSRDKPLRQKQISLSEGAGQAVLGLAERLEKSPLRQALEQLGKRVPAGSDHQGKPLQDVQSKKNQ